MDKNKIVQRLRQRRSRIEFQRAFDNASPSMRQELTALASRHNVNR